MTASACKARRQLDSGLKTAVSPNTEVYSACVKGYGGACDQLANVGRNKIVFYAQNPDGTPILSQAAFTHDAAQNFRAGGLTISVLDRNNQPVRPNNENQINLSSSDIVNYGYVQLDVDCVLAHRFAVNPDVDDPTKANQKCDIYMDTEDRGMYAVTIVIKDPQLQAAVDNYQGDPRFFGLTNGSSERTNFDIQPLAPNSPLTRGLAPGREINVKFDQASSDKVVATMKKFYEFYTRNGQNAESIREWRTCLRNGRAVDWLDLQAHFYCILPYSPHRQCYSTSLVDLTQGIGSEPDANKRMAKLFTAYNQSFDKCFGKGKIRDQNDPMYQDPNADQALNETYKIFKTIMWTKTGLMDFNIEWSNATINAFFEQVKQQNPQIKGRFVRLLDPTDYVANDPTRPPGYGWRPNQLRYDNIRFAQSSGLSRIPAPQPPPPPPRNEYDQIREDLAAALPEPDLTAPVNDLKRYRDYSATLTADVAAQGGYFPLSDERKKAIIAAMEQVNRRFKVRKFTENGQEVAADATSLNYTTSCLTTGYRPTHWSDLQVHYYCLFREPRYCYTNNVTAEGSRIKGFEKCMTDEQDPNNFPGPANPNHKNSFIKVLKEPEAVAVNQADIFKYIMFGRTFAFSPADQQEIINTFWGVSPNADAAECKQKRPVRTEDPQDGSHCSPTKTYKIPLVGRGR
jgi:hypothetical protein